MPVAACSVGADAAADMAQAIPLTIAANGQVHRFAVEVARSEEEQRQGLMFRTELPKNGGMLFPFAKPRIASFWMKNTLIPLDMIFIRPILPRHRRILVEVEPRRGAAGEFEHRRHLAAAHHRLQRFGDGVLCDAVDAAVRSEEHTSELQSLMRN